METAIDQPVPPLPGRTTPLPYLRTYGSFDRPEEEEGRTPARWINGRVCSMLSQFLACLGKYLCMLNIGLVGALPVLLIPLVTAGSFHIQLDKEEIGNFVSVIYIVMPIGSLLASLPIRVTRKPPMIITQLLFLISWIGTYNSTQVWHLFSARAIGGLAMTLSQPHIASYIGEVTIPELRGIFGNITQTMCLIGQLIISNLTYLHNWYTSVIICGSFALLSMLYLFFIPESPMLLIAYGENDKALKSLRQLRGWRWGDEKAVLEEFNQLIKHYAISSNPTLTDNTPTDTSGFDNSAYEPEPEVASSKPYSPKVTPGSSSIQEVAETPIYHIYNESMIAGTSSTADLQPPEDDDYQISIIKYFCKPKMYKPLVILVFCTLFVVGPGSMAITQFLSYVLQELKLSQYYTELLITVTTSTLGGNIASTCLVYRLGKKKIIMISTICAAIGYGALIAYVLCENFVDPRVWPVAALLAWTIFMEAFGICTVYHTLLSELFPMRGKRLGMSIVVLMVCINGVLIGEQFPSVLSSCGVLTVLVFDFVLCALGAVFFHINLFETEGKTLKEIEDRFEGR